MNTIKTKDCVGIEGRVRIIKTDAKTGRVKSVSPWEKNLVVIGTDTGKDLILDRLGGDNTYSLNITHADIGTGTNTPANSDTALQTPVARAVKGTASVSGNTLTLQFFFADGDLANGTYREFGTFVDGTSSTSTGKLFNRILFGTGYTKATGEDTTVEVAFSIS